MTHKMGNFWLLIWWLWHTKTFRVANLQKAIASHTSNANWIGWAGDHVQQLQQLVNLIHKKYNEYLITRMYYLKPNSIFFLQLISEYLIHHLKHIFQLHILVQKMSLWRRSFLQLSLTMQTTSSKRDQNIISPTRS